MVLRFSPPPDFKTCDTKRFVPREEHITRIHKRSVLILMTEGVLRFAENGKEIELTRGEYYIQRQGLLQEGLPLDRPPVYFFIEFDGSFSEGSDGLSLRGRFDTQRIQTLTERFEKAFTRHTADPYTLNSYMLRILSELLSTSSESDENSNLAELVKNYINANYSSKISLDDIAKKFSYTPDYIGTVFKRTFGITPHRYLSEVRMEQARWLLENTRMSAEQISASIGYEDFSSFYRCFKKTFGSSPRSLCRKNKS